MKGQKKKQNGITLIALVISIIVMLILAGVSISATIGDNGIITQAQRAKYMTSIAVLEDFINQKYVEEYDRYESDEKNTIEQMKEFHPEYFYIPKINSNIALDDVVGMNGKIYYLINKDGLPSEIKDSLTGGDAKNKTYEDYLNLNDVYGVTSNFKVYYCSKGIKTIIGLEEDLLDDENPFKVQFAKDAVNTDWYNLLASYDTDNDESLNVQELKKVTTLTIDASSNLENLENLKRLPYLSELTLNGLQLTDLKGIESLVKLSKISIINGTTITDCSALASRNNSLKTLYISQTTDAQLGKILDGMGTGDFNKLEEISIVSCGTALTDVSKLGNLSSNTQKSVTSITITGNDVVDVSALSGYENVINLNVGSNKIETLYDATKNMTKIRKLYAYSNNLTDENVSNLPIESQALGGLYGHDSLYQINLSNNVNLRYLEGLSTHWANVFNEFHLGGCTNLLPLQVDLIADLYNRSYAYQRSIPSGYEQYLVGTAKLLYNNKSLTDTSSDVDYLIGLSQSRKDKVRALSLANNGSLSDSKIEQILQGYNNLTSLNLNGCTNLTNLNFLKHMPNMVEFLFKDTAVTGDTVAILDEYCPKIQSIECNNTGINLTKMQNTISNLRRDIGLEYSFYSLGGTRIGDLAAQLSACNTMTFLETTNLNYSGTIDLSELTQKISIGFAEGFSGTIILPQHVGLFRFNTNDVYDFSAVQSIDGIYCENGNIDRIAVACSNINKYNIKVGMFAADMINYTGNTVSSYEDEDLDIDTVGYTPGELITLLKGSNLRILLLGGTFKTDGGIYTETQIGNIEKNGGTVFEYDGIWFVKHSSTVRNTAAGCFHDIDFSEGFDNLELFVTTKNKFNNIDFVGGATNLKYLDLPNAEISDISSLSSLTNLEHLDLHGNPSISSTYDLKDLSKLEYLNLENCSIEDRTSFSINGSTVTSINLDNLANLNKKGKLRCLFLAGNESTISDWSAVSSIKNWTEHSGW